MPNIRSILGTLIPLFFGIVMILPLTIKDMAYLTSTSVIEDIPREVSETLWIFRSPEIYFHAFFLAASIIASLVALRKPPEYVQDEEKFKPIPKHVLKHLQEGGEI